MKIIGVHPIAAPEPCHLIEIELDEDDEAFDGEDFTQEVEDTPSSDWQVAYDETSLNEEGTRWAFFFHYLDLSCPLITPAGPQPIPALTPLPKRLRHVKYEEP